MPFPDHVFRHAPGLKGRITDPAVSKFRFNLERYAELDAIAREAGEPPDWRLSHEEREANRRATLAGRLESDLWVFAYGSLIWDPGVYVAELRRARIVGWHRRFCLRITGGRGSRETPALMAGLDAGGSCEGVAFRIAADLVDRETEILWMREMIAAAYMPRFVGAETPQGPVEALTFVIDRHGERYCPGLDEAETARMIATARGRLGDNFEYLENLVDRLESLDLHDPELARLLEAARAIRSDAGL